ncbi:putative glycosyltransferase [Magnetofaba australis IT-1]|uniref:Putative glycosyltransferase n=2 Tax=Magnetofaba TaxID=1472292 RepID=A0A1Y2K0K7_9PROT|nr:putative glycosyltransferase [Magnetofaba australis IT-1]
MDANYGVLIQNEPTSYLVARLAAFAAAPGFPNVRVFFIGANLSQNWGIDLPEEIAQVLPNRRSAAVWRLAQAIFDRRCRFIHIAGWGGSALHLPALLLILLSGKPFTMESDTPEMGERRHWLKALLRRAWLRLLFARALWLLPAGSPQARLMRNMGADPAKIHPSQLTVDVAAIRQRREAFSSEDRAQIRARYGVADADPVILYVGRLEPYKGVMLLLDAFEQLAAQWPNARLLVAGGGSLEAEVQARAQTNPQLIALGRVQPHEVMMLMFSAHMLAMPSRIEPWGLVVNEAMAAGLPVIASECVGAVEDLISDGVTGLIRPHHDAAAWANAMAQMARNPQLRAQLAQAADQRIAHWTLQDQARIFQDHWSPLLRGDAP